MLQPLAVLRYCLQVPGALADWLVYSLLISRSPVRIRKRDGFEDFSLGGSPSGWKVGQSVGPAHVAGGGDGYIHVPTAPPLLVGRHTHTHTLPKMMLAVVTD